MRKLAILTFLALMAGSAYAQAPTAQSDLPKYLDLLQRNIWETRGEVMTQAMDLSTADAAIFWPIYREYELEANRISDSRNELISRYAAVFATMTDAQANELAQTTFTLDQEEWQLRKTYYERMMGALGAGKASRFAQIDNQVSMLIRLRIATQLPLLRKVQ